MDNLLGDRAGGAGPKADGEPGAYHEHRAGKATAATGSKSPSLLLTSMRNRQRNYAMPFLAISEKGE
jgi:hypothetical protein